jgi:hypothetical protein
MRKTYDFGLTMIYSDSLIIIIIIIILIIMGYLYSAFHKCLNALYNQRRTFSGCLL